MVGVDEGVGVVCREPSSGLRQGEMEEGGLGYEGELKNYFLARWSGKSSLISRGLNEEREQVEVVWSVGKEHPRLWEQGVKFEFEG